MSLLSTVLVSCFVGLLLVASPATASPPTTTTSTTTTTTTTNPTTTTTTTNPTTTTTSTIPTTTTTTTIPNRPILSWPSQVTAAVAVPQLSVVASSPSQPRVPIASLTKMMTTWVVLHALPLSPGQNGPCETIGAGDVGIYKYDVESGQSTAKIVAGMTLCESVLLRGMLVHSAGDYAELLVMLTGMHQPTFVAAMNQYARALGLRHTHYVDVTGISIGDVSTAQDQATLAADLMTNEAIVRGIVSLPRTLLPVAGVVQSFTPFVGQGGVVGVKSGFTGAAGGCDVMAVQFHLMNSVITTYAVVLGAHGNDPLGTAGTDALALSRSIRSSIARVVTSTGLQIQWIGSPADLMTPSKISKARNKV